MNDDNSDDDNGARQPRLMGLAVGTALALGCAGSTPAAEEPTETPQEQQEQQEQQEETDETDQTGPATEGSGPMADGVAADGAIDEPATSEVEGDDDDDDGGWQPGDVRG